MKKLLSLLSVLTISGTTMPTVIANAQNNKANNVLATAPDYCTTVPNINNIDTYHWINFWGTILFFVCR